MHMSTYASLSRNMGRRIQDPGKTADSGLPWRSVAQSRTPREKFFFRASEPSLGPASPPFPSCLRSQNQKILKSICFFFLGSTNVKHIQYGYVKWSCRIVLTLYGGSFTCPRCLSVRCLSHRALVAMWAVRLVGKFLLTYLLANRATQ
jgi:hypothetical protein